MPTSGMSTVAGPPGHDLAHPVLALAIEHDGARVGLLQNDVALDGRGGAIFLVLDDQIVVERFVAQDLEHDDGVVDDRRPGRDVAAHDECVRVADLAIGHANLELTAEQ